MIDAADVFNPKDFASIRLIVHFQDLTTRTEIKDPDKVKIVEVDDKVLVLELPAKTCNTKHSVMVRICQFTNKKERELLTITGKILDLQDVGAGSVRASVDCVQLDERSWKNFLALFANRQAEIEKFFTLVKGY